MSEQENWLPDIRVLEHVQILAETLDYNHKMMNIPSMWRLSRGAGVKVAILDTGLPSHPDLMPCGAESFIDGYLKDENGHSTHCGGIIAAVADNGMGVAGIAPDCEDYYGAILDASGGGGIKPIAAGIRWAVDEVGADIISMSVGAQSKSTYKELEKACDYAADQGVAIFAASGNANSFVAQPARFDSVIAVAAVNNAHDHAQFSNYGKEVDFAAGGVDVYSTYIGNSYAKLSGTSMACPALAAVAALIKAEHKLRGENLPPTELKDHLYKIAYDVESPGVDKLTGHGIPIFGSGNPYNPGITEPQEPEAPAVKKAGFDPDCIHWKLAQQLFIDVNKRVQHGKVEKQDAFAEFAYRATRLMRRIERDARTET